MKGARFLRRCGRHSSKMASTLSPQAVVTTTDPGNQWAVSDDQSEQVFSLRREKTGLAVYSAYDPRIRPWYRNAIGRDSAVWTEYPDFGAGKYLFSLGKELESQIGDKVSPSLAQEFARRQISLVANSRDSQWATKASGHYRIGMKIITK